MNKAFCSSSPTTLLVLKYAYTEHRTDGHSLEFEFYHKKERRGRKNDRIQHNEEEEVSTRLNPGPIKSVLPLQM